ncbi:hypothetical protein SO802_010189 [Lithocarpus litseifolius]|uniref:Protein kinase domain-containing protein n=1 Tax=Lithocarpus litseifolius TaxID=425828 RepID=A0AAW2DFU1_9ROSI
MPVHLVMQAFMLLLSYELAEAAPPIAKPNCKSSCGNLQIPYPFGIGPECYLDKWFEIVCNGTGGSAQAFITSIDKEVRQIIIGNNPSTNNFIEPTVQVQVPTIYSQHCKYAGNHSIVNITGSPFHFSHYHNAFISVGCDNNAIIDNIFPKVFGCESDCKKDMKVDKKVKCSGFNCCESTNIPSNLQAFDVRFRSRNKSNDEEGGIKHCKYAFLADKGWLEKSKRDPSSVQYWEYVPVVLEWAIFLRNNNSRKLYHFLEGGRKVRCFISDENKDYFYSFFCHCAPGYKGNPYVDGGCEDINECEDHLHNCKNKLDCENTEGGYNCEKRKSKLKIVIVGFGTGLGVLFLPTTWVLYKLIKKKIEIKLKKKFFKKNGGLLLQQQLSSTKNNVQNTKLFNSKELKKATDHFSKDRIIGKGGQGTVYKGMLGDGQIIAIKKCNIVDKANLEHFINEIVILSQINHRNVVKLLGCCLETEVPLLIYEFIPNGTLFQYIHEENEGVQLTWAMRLKIAIEIAGALSYLHSAASLPIYHRDIKSTNILLDEKYRAKVADFGTSKIVKIDQTHVTTVVQGTFGYLDPEYFQTGQFTEKSDVYSFGVVLVELLTGEKPVSSTRSEEGRSLSTYFILSMNENHLFDILDDCVREEGDKEDIIIVANLAKKCLHLNGKERPTMGEVAMELQGIQKKDTNGQENYEELHNVRSKEIDPSYACSTTTQSYSEIASSSSSIVLPSSSFKSL